MTSIVLRDMAGLRTVKLTPARAKLFNTELRRVRAFYPSGKGRPPLRVAPDCSVHVRKNKKRREYEVYGRTVLYDKQAKKRWQFYFSLLLLEWLYT